MLNRLMVFTTLFSDFGDEEVDALADHFKPGLENLIEEWTSLKSDVYSSAKWEKDLATLTWADMNRLYGKKYHNILSLMDLILSLPVSTAECERGFSWLKRTKTDWRANLGATSLNDLMCCALESATVESFDPLPAVDLWTNSTQRARRITYAESQPRKSTAPHTQTTAETEEPDLVEDLLKAVEEEEEADEVGVPSRSDAAASDEELELEDGEHVTRPSDILLGLKGMGAFHFHYNRVEDEEDDIDFGRWC